MYGYKIFFKIGKTLFHVLFFLNQIKCFLRLKSEVSASCYIYILFPIHLRIVLQQEQQHMDVNKKLNCSNYFFG